MESPGTMDLAGDIETFWTSGLLAKDLIKSYEIFVNRKLTGTVVTALHHGGIQGSITNPLVELENIVTHCTGGGSVSERILWVSFASYEKTKEMPFIAVLINDVNQCVGEYLHNGPGEHLVAKLVTDNKSRIGFPADLFDSWEPHRSLAGPSFEIDPLENFPPSFPQNWLDPLECEGGCGKPTAGYGGYHHQHPSHGRW